jgi:hypothetical protein
MYMKNGNPFYPRNLLRFAPKISKAPEVFSAGGAQCPLGTFLPCKLHRTEGSKQPINRGFCIPKWSKNLQSESKIHLQQAARVAVCWLIAVTIACATPSQTAEARAAPPWVQNLEQVYPSREWVAVTAQGADRNQAESAAMNALARAFKTDVASLSSASQQFTQAFNTMAGKQSVSFDQSQNFAQEVNTASNVRGLIGVETDVYTARDGTVYASARMNRAECGRRYQAMIRENDRVITQLLETARRLPVSFDAYSALNFAYNLAVPTDNFQGIWEVLDARAVSQKPSYGSADAIKTLRQNTARAIVILVTVEGDVNGRILRAFSQLFSERGFRTTRSGTATYRFNAALNLEKADLGPSQRYPAVQYLITVYAEDKNRIEVFSYSGEGRSVHPSESEARQQALREVEASVGEKEFALAFDAYLSSLLK